MTPSLTTRSMTSHFPYALQSYVRHVRHASWCLHPPSSVHIALAPPPPERGQHGGDAPGVSGPEAVDLFEIERRFGDLQDRCAADGNEKLGDGLFPRIAFIAGGLLVFDVLLLEFAIRPPVLASAIERDSLGEELVAILRQRLDIDARGLDWPEPASTGFVAEISFAIGAADK